MTFLDIGQFYVVGYCAVLAFVIKLATVYHVGEMGQFTRRAKPSSRILYVMRQRK